MYPQYSLTLGVSCDRAEPLPRGCMGGTPWSNIRLNYSEWQTYHGGPMDINTVLVVGSKTWKDVAINFTRLNRFVADYHSTSLSKLPTYIHVALALEIYDTQPSSAAKLSL